MNTCSFLPTEKHSTKRSNPLSARTREPFSNFSVNSLTKGGGKNGKEKERKTKGGAPRPPTPPKGGEDSRRGRRGGRE